MRLEEALEQITEIRAQIARTETFRGYRAATVGFSGVLGVGAAAAQPALVPGPQQEVESYLALWIGVAAVSVMVVAAEMLVRSWRAVSPRTIRLTRLAVEQFLPCVVAGAVLTGMLYSAAPEGLWMLPGLWAVVFSLGVFASCRLLPRAMFWVGVYYLVAGACCIAYAHGENAFAPWTMGVTFGGGQLLTAAILYWTLERSHETS